jgi:hypothetical protein
MKYEYVGFPDKDPKAAIYRPYLVVRAASNDKFTDTFCLIDSGADYCMMPSSLGKLIGIDVKSGPEQEIKGIGAQSSKGILSFSPHNSTETYELRCERGFL